MLIQSDRLFIRNTVLEDIPALYGLIFSDREVVKHTFGREVDSPEAAQQYIEQHCNFSGEFGLATLIERQSDNVIGLSGVIESNYLGRTDYEFGFILGREYWGKGYATEIGQAQIDYIREVLQADRVIALAATDNISSIRTIAKLGLTKSSTLNTPNRGERYVFIRNF